MRRSGEDTRVAVGACESTAVIRSSGYGTTEVVGPRMRSASRSSVVARARGNQERGRQEPATKVCILNFLFAMASTSTDHSVAQEQEELQARLVDERALRAQARPERNVREPSEEEARPPGKDNS